jgi:hypothetical protein
MERAGKPRHRSYNPRSEGEIAGCDRINPPCPPLDGLAVARWVFEAPLVSLSIL